MEVLLAKVALSSAIYAIDKPYDYLIPPDLRDTLQPGMRVIVPFGRGNRRTDGMVLAVRRENREEQLKQIIAALDDQPVLDSFGLKLALWIREQYFCTVYDAIKAMLPAGLYFSLKDSYHIIEGVDRETAFEAAGQSETALCILRLLYANGGQGELEQIRGALGTKNPGPALRTLMDKGILRLETSAMRGVGDKREQIATLLIPAEEAVLQAAPRRKSAPLRYAVIELLAAVGSASTKEICYFTGASGATLRALAKSGIISLEKREVFRRAVVECEEAEEPIRLNAEQQAAFEGLNTLAEKGEPSVSLLYGVTGSGKTQVYLRLIQETLNRGRDALVLVPEIALTPQMLRIFTSYFGAQTAILHSSLRAGERYDEWKRIQRGAAHVVIGTRSAVFAPLKNLGLIILDEEQEYSYKSENAPRYHARDVAKYRCNQHHALLVLGSATPSLESRWLAEKGVYHCQALTHRYNECALPEVLVADMREELRAGNGTAVSEVLRKELELNLSRGEQAILFLNRRGASRMVSCGECGYVPICPRCEVHLTYHSANHRLMCHHCGHSEPYQEFCPECGGTFQLIGTGTQKLQEELQNLFPGAGILRMDTDTVTARLPHEKILDKFQKERIPILVGTQMVAKGLDFENVTLVGVIDADLALYVDDFRAAERTFSLLTQVIGRAGRGSKRGRAVIQTYTPEHEVIQFAAAQDYDSFYSQEIMLRRLRSFPPFSDIITLSVSGLEAAAVLRACMVLRTAVEREVQQNQELSQLPIRLLGPAMDRIPKVNHRYRYHLTLCTKNTRALRRMLSGLLCGTHTDKRFRGVSIVANCNPLQ